MRELYILSGPPCAGKSTWIKENQLELYTLDIDVVRSMVTGPILNIEGHLESNMFMNDRAWGYLFFMLEDRMRRGETVLVDAVNLSPKFYLFYKILAKRYFYKIFKVDFFTVSFEEIVNRNAKRVYPRKLEDSVLYDIYSLFENMKIVSEDIKNNNANNFLNIETIRPKEAVNKLYKDTIVCLDNYKEIVIFGLIGDFYKDVEDYFIKNPFRDDTFYIFMGGYVSDKFNADAIKFLTTIYDKPNVILLEDTSFKYIMEFMLDFELENPNLLKRFNISEEWKSTLKRDSELGKAHEFIKLIFTELEDVNKVDLEKLCYCVLPFYNFSFHGNVYTISNGALSKVPDRFISCEQCVQGVMNRFYQNVAQLFWANNTKENEYSIFCNIRAFVNTKEDIENRFINLYNENGVSIHTIRGV